MSKMIANNQKSNGKKLFYLVSQKLYYSKIKYQIYFENCLPLSL